MQRSSTWILKSLWGACERWSKSDCIDLSAAFAYYTLQSFFPILLISLSIASWFLGKQEGLDQQIIDIAAAWLLLEELNCSIEWLETDPLNLVSGENLSDVNFPLIACRSIEKFEILKPWGNLLLAK